MPIKILFPTAVYNPMIRIGISVRRTSVNVHARFRVLRERKRLVEDGRVGSDM